MPAQFGLRANEAGGTRLKVALQYQPPAGVMGAAAAKLLGESPDEQLASDLRRFKEILETGVPAGSQSWSQA
jgi:uncharacterized membrane protein